MTTTVSAPTCRCRAPLEDIGNLYDEIYVRRGMSKERQSPSARHYRHRCDDRDDDPPDSLAPTIAEPLPAHGQGPQRTRLAASLARSFYRVTIWLGAATAGGFRKVGCQGVAPLPDSFDHWLTQRRRSALRAERSRSGRALACRDRAGWRSARLFPAGPACRAPSARPDCSCAAHPAPRSVSLRRRSTGRSSAKADWLHSRRSATAARPSSRSCWGLTP